MWDSSPNNGRRNTGADGGQWGSEDYIVKPTELCGKTCLYSTQDRDLAKGSMHSCDESMSLLLGSQVSVGRLKAIANLIEEKGPSRMPGYCCMDVATNSEFFGYDVSD